MSTIDTDALDRADMERLVGGHDAALNDLMDRHAAPVFAFLCRMVRNESDANDLAQETFVRVYQSRARYRAKHKFTTWLYTIAANLARNHIRWRMRHPGESIESESEQSGASLADRLQSDTNDPHQTLAADEQAHFVREAVWNLPEDLREALVLCEWEERSMAEAAAILDATPKAIESRLYRARQRLRESLKHLLPA